MEDIKKSLELYVKNGIAPGSFLRAVLENDLIGAIGHADQINRYRIYDIVMYIYNEIPEVCWGNKEKVRRWIEHKGLKGAKCFWLKEFDDEKNE